MATSLWDTSISGRLNGYGVQNGSPTFSATGYTTAQMQNPAHAATIYPTFDFTDIWTAPTTGTYAKLKGTVAH